MGGSGKKKKKKRKADGGAGGGTATGKGAIAAPACRLPGAGIPLWAAALAVLALAVIPYLNTFRNEFVTFDDDKVILSNKAIRELSLDSAAGMFASYIPGRDHPVDFPLTNLTWAVNYRLHGYEPWGYHLGNVALHASACLLLLLLLLRAGPWGRDAAFWAAVIFAVHPVHAESVTWMTCRKDVLSGALVFGAMLAYVSYIRACRPGRAAASIAVSMVLWVAALFAKPTAVAAPVLMLVWVLFAEHRGVRKRAVAGLAPFVILAGVFAWTQVLVSAERGIVSEYVVGGPAQAALAGGYVLLQFARLAVLPVGLSAHHVVLPPGGALAVLYAACWVAVAAGCAALLWGARRKPGILFYPLWFAAALLPVLQVVPTRIPLAERYLYLPSVAACLGIAVAARAIACAAAKKYPRAPLAAAVALSALALVLAAGTIVRNTAWRNSETLWADTVKKSPNSPIALNNLGMVYEKKGDSEKAEKLYLQSIDTAPRYFFPYLNLGVLYGRRGEPERAIEYLEAAQELEPDRPTVHQNMAVALLQAGRPGEALLHAQKLLELQPGSEAALDLLCEAYFRLENFSRAAETCARYLDIRPADIRAVITLADSLYSLERYPEALEAYSRVAAAYPGGPAAWYRLGVCAYLTGDYTRAAAAMRRAVELDPGSEKAKEFLGAIQQHIHPPPE